MRTLAVIAGARSKRHGARSHPFRTASGSRQWQSAAERRSAVENRMASTRPGSRSDYRAADYTDFAHTGPGTLAGRYLRQFWQPVYVASDLPPGQAKPIRVMGEDYTLYRGGDSMPHLVDARCAHRGTQLSTGWVEGDCIRCFYHGWKYDGSGQCVEQPAEDASFASKVRIQSYPVQEYLGLVFAYLGDAERGDTGAFNPPPLPRYPEFKAPGVLLPDLYTRQCNYFQHLENGVDEVHLAFVHRRSGFTDFGFKEWDIPQVRAEETDYGMAIYTTRSNGVPRLSYFLMPNMIRFKGAPVEAASGWTDHLGWRVPVDDAHHRAFSVVLAHVTGEAAERYREVQRQRRALLAEAPAFHDLAEQVLRGELRVQDIADHPSLVMFQDTVAQVGQGVIADRQRERLGRSDVSVMLLRRLWERELRALAEGRPLKEWRAGEALVTTSGV
jgi:5,5'-dehydrodivanillate O-demethylase